MTTEHGGPVQPDTACEVPPLVDPGDLPQVSVVVPTIGRSDALRQTLASVRASHYPNLDVVLVVNGDEETVGRVAAEQAPFEPRLVHEPHLGAARARNAGAAHAAGSVLLFVDDDVVLHPHMLCNAVAPLLDGSSVGCVTGRILPMSVEAEAERLLEQYVGYDKGVQVRRFGAADLRPGGALYPFLPGRLGSGAAMAMPRAVFVGLGGFDERLGPGTPARGAEDLDLLVRVLKAGLEVHYAPAAVVRHRHRSDLAGLGRQLHEYGIGMGALVTKELVGDWTAPLRMLVRLPAGARYVLSPRSAKNERKVDRSWRLTAGELLGLLRGPLAFARSCLVSGARRHTARARSSGIVPPARLGSGRPTA
jgi:GT2 family glycosyltransferase